jgi:adenylate cyclase
VTEDRPLRKHDRRLAAILAADVVAYSRLMGADEEGTLTALHGHRTEAIDPALKDHNGRLVKTTGDGFLVEFASVVDALRCAIQWQAAIASRNASVPANRQIVFRIGVNLGDVIVEDDDIYGDGVNVAARLEGLAKPGTICISRAARDQVRDKLPINLEALGALRVKNIARPVQAFLIVPANASPTSSQRGAGTRMPGKRNTFIVIAVIGLAGLLIWLSPVGLHNWSGLGRTAPSAGKVLPLPDKPSIAVLPFDNLGESAQELRLGDAIAENIISSLAKISSMFVISRNSAFSFKGTARTTEKIAEDLGVRFVMEGSVQKSSEKVRVSAQLVDTRNRSPLWSETYDRKLTDLFALQDEITLSIVTALQVELTQGEVARVRQRGTNNLRAWLLVNQSMDHLMRFTRDDNAQARALAEEAVSIDPNYPEAYVRLGRAFLTEFHAGWVPDPASSLRRSIELVQKALALDPTYPDTYHLLATIYLFLKRHDDARVAIEKALELSPNHSLAKANLGMILNYSGHPDEAITAFEEAMRLSPIYPNWYRTELAPGVFSHRAL